MNNKRIIGTFFILCFISVLPAFGQQQGTQPPQYQMESAPVTIHKISSHVYEVRGGIGANSAFIVGDKGIFVIDAKMDSRSAKEMIGAIARITEKPVSHILLTHSDGDHVNGLTGFPGNIDIIAHNNSAKHMKHFNETGQEKIPLPNETFSHRMNLYSGDLEISLFYLGPAHTDGDVVIYVPEDNVAIIGDLFFKGRDPLIHMHKNGNSSGLIRALQEIIDLDAGSYLSGHAEPVGKSEIENLRKNIIEKQDKIRDMVKDGKSLNEVKQAFGISIEKSRWPSLAEVIYLELTKIK